MRDIFPNEIRDESHRDRENNRQPYRIRQLGPLQRAYINPSIRRSDHLDFVNSFENTKIEFKCVVMEGQTVKRWENFSNDANRKYKAKWAKTTLKGSENDDGGKEFVNEIGENNEKLQKNANENHKNRGEITNFNEPSPEKNKNAINSKDSDLALIDNTTINRPNIGSLDPWDIDDGESEDSNNSSLFEMGPEGTPQKKKPINQRLSQLRSSLDEIKSVKSSDSLDFEKKARKTALLSSQKQELGIKATLNANVSMVFKKLKEKHFRMKSKSPLSLTKKNFSQDFEDETNEYTTIDENFNEKYSLEKDCILVVCKFLPIKINQSNDGEFSAKILKDSNQFYLMRHLLNGNYKKVLCVGLLRDFVEEKHRKNILFLLKTQLNCIPIFLNFDVKEMFLLSHEIFSMLDSLILNNYSTSVPINEYWTEKDRAWEVLREINGNYCEILNKFADSEYKNVFITDYHFILLPNLLAKASNFTIGFYFNANFPTFEVFRLFPFKDEFLAGLLQSDLIYFNCFDQARPFFTALLIEKNVKVHSRAGLLHFFFNNHTTFIKLKYVTVDSLMVKNMQKIPIPLIKSLENPNFNLILGLDRISELTGIDLKMKLIAQWVQESSNQHNIKFIQILQKPYYGPLSEKQKIWLENIRKIEKQLNSKLDFPDPIIELIEFDPNEQESLFLMSKAKVLLNTSIKNEYCIDSMKFLLTKSEEKQGHVLLSEFMNYNRSCGSIFSFNPLKYSDFKQKLDTIMKMRPTFSRELLNADITYLLKNPINSWFSEVFSLLKAIEFSKKTTLKPREIPYNPSLPFFDVQTLASDYEKSSNRIFIFEFFGTLVRSTSITDFNRFSKKSIKQAFQLNEKLMKTLKLLIKDQRNTVYVISSKSVNNLDIVLGNFPEIGLAAESGYLYKLKGKEKWSKLMNIDCSWKEVVRKNMENYTRNTTGSTLEIKESALTWNYEAVPFELAEKQSISLISHLKSSLEKIKDVNIFVGNHCVEARPAGISKATFISLLLQSYQKINDIDFIMVMGEDQKMFGKVRNFIKKHTDSRLEAAIKKYLIWVGPDRKEGDYFLRDCEEVRDLMQRLGEKLFADFNE